jgi:NitT/TauT family transport system substrate-binding protein
MPQRTKHMLHFPKFAFALAVGLACPVAAQPFHVEVSLGDVSLQKVPFLIAADEGIYAKNGLEVHQFITPTAAKMVEGLGIHVPKEYIGKEGQTAPFEVGGGVAVVFRAREPNEKARRTIVATQENIARMHIIARPEIRTEQDLKGKTLATSLYSVAGYDGAVYLKRLGLSNHVKVVERTDLAALNAGKVDAIMAPLFTVAQAQKQGLNDLVDLSKYKIPQPGSGISVDKEYLAANREIVARFVKAAAEATAIMKKDRKAFSAVLAKWYKLTDEDMIDRLFNMAQGFPDKPYPPVEGIKMALEVYSTPNLDKMRPEDFYDSSFVEALDKDGTLDRLVK